MIPAAIASYNNANRTSQYNVTYSAFINARKNGLAAHGGVYGWVHSGNAAGAIHTLLGAFGMDGQRSKLVPLHTLVSTLCSLNKASIQWVENIEIPISAPCSIVNPTTGRNLAVELSALYTALSIPGAVTVSGGFVAASKTLHCLFPDLAPMIDGRHTGLSYYHIQRATYSPPSGINGWANWLGTPLLGLPNPSPRGAGRYSWDAARFLASIGVNQHIYELWQQQNGNPGFQAFLAMDPAPGTSGIPRIIDKLLW